MNQLAFLAYSHGHSSSWTDWIAHRAVSAVIHAVIYGAVFKFMRHMTTGETIVVAVVVWLCPRIAGSPALCVLIKACT